MPFDRNGLEVLTREDCADLLARTSFGRVGVSIGALPVVLPVNYGILGDDVVFRTVEGTKLAGAADRTVVAFEVDAIDDGGDGWSVLVIGMSEVVTDPDERTAANEVVPDTWLPPAASQVVRIRTDMVSGRRLSRVR